MITNSEFLRQYRQAIDPYLFDLEDHQLIAKSILEHYDDYDKPPDFKTLAWRLESETTRKPFIADSWKKQVKAMHQRLKRDGDQLSFVHDQTEQFIRRQVLGGALSVAVDYWKVGEYEKAIKTVKDVEQYTIQPVDGIDFFEDIYQRLVAKDVRETISTGIKSLDQYLDGGTAKGELTVILAPTGVGKTCFLVNMGAAAALKGMIIYHFFVEETEDKIWFRYACRFGKASRHQLQDQPKKFTYKLQKLKQRNPQLRIVHSLGWSVSSMRGYIYRHGTPDAIVVDYADELLATQAYNERRHEISRIYRELVMLGKEFNCAVWTASQTNRQALGKDKITLKDIAEAYEKAMIADNVLALCQSEQESATQRMRIFMAKVRNAEAHREIPCRILYKQMRVIDDTSTGRSRIEKFLKKGNQR